MTTQLTLGRRVALAAVYLERYGLSLVFLIMAGIRIHQLVLMGQAERAQVAAAPLTGILSQIIWVQLYLYVGLLLLVGRRVMSPPQNLLDLVVPVGTTFFYLAYSAVLWLPMAFQKSLCPPSWQHFCLALGLFFNLAGLCVTVWAAIHLGRSFGILIEVRKPVMQGAYRWVRHPMYVGDFCFLIGFAIASFSVAIFILVPVHIALLLYRARLEETRLAEVSPEYAEYRKRTGFVFPKFGGN
jgi:protein-S-isoprenylcysteine O-methyltransferase Ste14